MHFGQVLDKFEKANEKLVSPSIDDYNNLPPNIKVNYPNYNSYKSTVNNNNLQTRLAMKAQLQGLKENYVINSNGPARDKDKFDEEADELISKIGV